MRGLELVFANDPCEAPVVANFGAIFGRRFVVANHCDPPAKQRLSWMVRSVRVWQIVCGLQTETLSRERLSTGMSPSDRALVRSQSGPGAGVAFSASLSSNVDTPLFRVFVQRRFRLSLLLSQHICGCGLLSTLLALRGMFSDRGVGQKRICS